MPMFFSHSMLKATSLCAQLYSEMLTEDRSKQNLTEIRALAKRHAMSFGIDLHRARKPVVALHMSVTHIYPDKHTDQSCHDQCSF